MTAYINLSSLPWAAVAAFFVSRLDKFAHRWLTISDPVAQSKATGPAEIPPDLEAFAMQESEKWAQDSVLATVRERYDAFHDWNKVRAALGVGTLD